MKEVSCSIFDVHFRELRKQGLPEELLGRNTPYDVAYLKNKRERVEWSVLVQVMKNLSTVWDDDELVRQGGLLLTNPLFQPFAIVARLLFDAREFYLWLFKPGSGIGNQLFTCVRPSARELASGWAMANNKCFARPG